MTDKNVYLVNFSCTVSFLLFMTRLSFPILVGELQELLEWPS